MQRFRSACAPVLGACGWLLGPIWLWAARRRYRRASRPLSDVERARYRGYFSDALLASVRVARVEALALPGARPAQRALGSRAVVGGARGIALESLVVLSHGGSRTEGPDEGALLFHELVHVAQFRVLGPRRFLAGYLSGWARGGFCYRSIPLEEQAFALQEAYVSDACGAFDAEEEVRRPLRSEPSGL